MSAAAKPPLGDGVRFIVREVIEDPDTGETRYALAPIADYPTRSIAVGDVFAPVDHRPGWVSEPNERNPK